MPLIPLLLLLALGYWGYRAWTARQTRRDLLASPLSKRQRAIVSRMVPLSRKLPTALRPVYEGKVRLFLHQVDFIGKEGLDVTEDMRLSIAAQACLLIAGTELWYDTLRTILIYPSAYKTPQTRRDGFVVTEGTDVRLGESWSRGPVVLSWEHTAAGARYDQDGRNLVIHEFAHQIDNMSGGTNGIPGLAKGQSYDQWDRIFTAAYEQLKRDVRSGRPTVIDPYGTTNKQEFFAVCTEVFFERPNALRAQAPEVYWELAKVFNLDPSTWNQDAVPKSSQYYRPPIWKFH